MVAPNRRDLFTIQKKRRPAVRAAIVRELLIQYARYDSGAKLMIGSYTPTLNTSERKV